MELVYLQEFITLAQTQNFLDAADELYISQSSLSKHIKAIESELGYTLFDRSTRKVQLSNFGKAYLPYAERIIALHNEASGALAMLSRDTDESLRLGVLPIFTIYDIYEKLGEFRKKYPSYTVSLIEGSNDELLRSLIEARCNVVLLRHDAEGLGPQFATIPFDEDHMVIVIPPGHPMDNAEGVIPLQALDGMELLTSTSNYITRTVNRLSETYGVHFNLTTRLTHSEVVIQMVLQEKRPALLMRKPTEIRHGDRVRMLDIQPLVTNQISFVYLKHKPLSSAAKAFLRTIFPKWEEVKPNA